jgi:hypothetical protein
LTDLGPGEEQVVARFGNGLEGVVQSSQRDPKGCSTLKFTPTSEERSHFLFYLNG